MNLDYLEFEQPIAELEQKINELRHVADGSVVNLGEEVGRLEEKSRSLTADIFAKLTPWQVSQVARHPRRPYTLDYIKYMCSEFQELHGDRALRDDAAIVGGLARIDNHTVMLIGHQKGRDTSERTRRNFGMPRPEGYRKALRLMHLAERFQLPIVTLIDTPGAYPGIGAEERNQSEAIARNLFEMARLRTPIISTVIGEGGSGGALAIGVCDHLLMLQFATYSVITPEGCASILWRSAEQAPIAAQAMGMTSADLLQHKLVDEVVKEPLGGAHRDPEAIAAALKQRLLAALERLGQQNGNQLVQSRYERLMRYGAFKE